MKVSLEFNIGLNILIQQDVVAHACHLSTCGVEAGGSGVQGHPLLGGKCKTNLACIQTTQS